jgi:hypothetical protein
MRKEFELTGEQIAELTAAKDWYAEHAVWVKLGKEMGFNPLTVRPSQPPWNRAFPPYFSADPPMSEQEQKVADSIVNPDYYGTFFVRVPGVDKEQEASE